ncbi:MAG: hypothetical protein GX352_10200 [Clostridiales bacterium]|nr:hypothetical protein [Clostridiales bacterium]
MDLKHFDEYISPYLDGKLNEEEKAVLENHLDTCTECMAKLEETRKLVQVLDSLDELPLPTDFHKNLTIKLEQSKRQRNTHWYSWAGAVAAIIIIFFSIKAVIGPLQLDKATESAPMEAEIATDESGEGDFKFEPGEPESPAAAPEDSNEKEARGDSEIARVEQEEMAPQGEWGEADSQAEPAEAPQDDGSYYGETRAIQTDVVEVYTEDICITPYALKLMALDNDMEPIESDENSVVIVLDGEDKRHILFEELSKMGEIKEVGSNNIEDQVRVIIKVK